MKCVLPFLPTTRHPMNDWRVARRCPSRPGPHHPARQGPWPDVYARWSGRGRRLTEALFRSNGVRVTMVRDFYSTDPEIPGQVTPLPVSNSLASNPIKTICPASVSLSACSRTAQRTPPGREWLRIRLEPARNDCDAVNRTWDDARNARVGQVAILVHIKDRQMRGPSEAAGAINRRDQT